MRQGNTKRRRRVRIDGRSAAVDLVRIVGVLAIVAGHVWNDGAVRQWTYPWHVPLFFFISGYLWKSGRRLRTDAARRVQSLLIPYVSWLILIGVGYLTILSRSGEFPASKLMDVLLGGSHITRPFSAFWFVTALLIACLVLRALEPLGTYAQWTVAALGLTAAYLDPSLLADIPWSAGVAIPSMAFLLFGQVLRRIMPRLQHPLVLALVLLTLAAAAVASGISSPLSMKYGDFGVPVLGVLVAVASSAGLILVAEELVPRLSRRIQAGAVHLATVALAVILSHAAVLWVLQRAHVDDLVSFVAAVTVPWAAALVIARTSVSWLFLGRPRTLAKKQANHHPSRSSGDAPPSTRGTPPNVPQGPLAGSNTEPDGGSSTPTR